MLKSVVKPNNNNCFRSGCVSIGNDPRTGRPRTSTDERSVKLVADALEDHRTCEELYRATGSKTSQEIHNNRPQLLVAGPFILLDNARPHIADVINKSFAIMGGKCYLMSPTVQT